MIPPLFLGDVRITVDESFKALRGKINELENALRVHNDRVQALEAEKEVGILPFFSLLYYFQ